MAGYNTELLELPNGYKVPKKEMVWLGLGLLLGIFFLFASKVLVNMASGEDAKGDDDEEWEDESDGGFSDDS